MENEAAQNKKKAEMKGAKVKEPRKLPTERDEQLTHREQEVCSLVEIVKRRLTSKHKHQSWRMKRETTALSTPPLSLQPEFVEVTEV